MEAPDPLRGPHLKLDWAKYHIDQFQILLTRIVSEHVDTVTVEPDSDPNRLLCVANDPFKLPEHLPLVVGDAVHNLRSAWDHLAVLLVDPQGQTGLKVQFPFASTFGKFKKRLKGYGFIERCSPAVVSAIYGLKPYANNGGNEEFFALHDLDILDKHRLIIAVADPEAVLPMVWIEENEVRTGTFTFTPENGRYVCRVPASGSVKLNQNFSPGLGVIFGDGMPLAGKSILKSLYSLFNFSRYGIDFFARFL